RLATRMACRVMACRTGAVAPERFSALRTPRFGVSEARFTNPGRKNAPLERDGLFDIVRWVETRCCPHPEERACASASAKSNARAPVSKDEDDHGMALMLRDASQRPESVEASVLARAAMLLSMRANQPVAVGEDRRPRSIVSRLLFTMNSATQTCRAQARRCRSQAAVKASGSARLRQRLGLSRGGRVGEMRYDFGRKQPHGLLGLAEIERAEIDLQR